MVKFTEALAWVEAAVTASPRSKGLSKLMLESHVGRCGYISLTAPQPLTYDHMTVAGR